MTDVAVLVSCDQCNARAYIHVRLTNGGTLAYCAHHGHQHTPALEASGATVINMTHMLEGS